MEDEDWLSKNIFQQELKFFNYRNTKTWGIQIVKTFSHWKSFVWIPKAEICWLFWVSIFLPASAQLLKQIKQEVQWWVKQRRQPKDRNKPKLHQKQESPWRKKTHGPPEHCSPIPNSAFLFTRNTNPYAPTLALGGYCFSLTGRCHTYLTLRLLLGLHGDYANLDNSGTIQ